MIECLFLFILFQKELGLEIVFIKHARKDFFLYENIHNLQTANLLSKPRTKINSNPWDKTEPCDTGYISCCNSIRTWLQNFCTQRPITMTNTLNFLIIKNKDKVLEIHTQILTSDSSKTSGFFILFFLDVFQSFTCFIFIFLFSDDNATTFVFSFLAFSFFEVFGSSSSSLSEDVSYLLFSYSDEVSESELTLLSTSLELFYV